MAIILIVISIILTLGIVWLIDKYDVQKYKSYILISLWGLIIYLSYITFMSVYGEIQFNKIKEKRYKTVIKNLVDIRDSQLAHRAVKGDFQKNWDSLIKFIEEEKFTITQRRDTTVLDKELTRRYGVDTTKDIFIVDTLGFVNVKDSLFGIDERYKTMMVVPVGEKDKVFELKTGSIPQNGINIPVFEVSVDKGIILFDQDENLIKKEKQVMSVEQVNGSTLKVGSIKEVNTNGNWPKNYSNKQ